MMYRQIAQRLLLTGSVAADRDEVTAGCQHRPGMPDVLQIDRMPEWRVHDYAIKRFYRAKIQEIFTADRHAGKS